LLLACNVWKNLKTELFTSHICSNRCKTFRAEFKKMSRHFSRNIVLFHLFLFGIFYYNNNCIASWTISKSLYIFIIFLKSNYLFQLNFHNNSLAKIITNSLKLCYIFFISKLKFHEHLESYNFELLYWKRRQSLELCISTFYCTQIYIRTLV
jgi:hypothetical protein